MDSLVVSSGFPFGQQKQISSKTRLLYVYIYIFIYMGVSENSVPLNPMVNDHYPYKMAIIGNIPSIFRQTHMYILL